MNLFFIEYFPESPHSLSFFILSSLFGCLSFFVSLLGSNSFRQHFSVLVSLAFHMLVLQHI